MSNSFKPATLCVQGGWQPKKGEPRVLPIYQSTTFKYETSEQMAKLFDLEESGYFYTRLQNPTNDAVASKIAALEGGVAAMLCLFQYLRSRRPYRKCNRYLWRNIQSAVCYPEKAGHRMYIHRPGCQRRGNQQGIPPEYEVIVR